MPDKQVAGFVILRGLTNPHRSVELMRIVITEKSRGFGRATLQLVKHIVFQQENAHRLWLDVRDNNPRARGLYESEGFIVEGTLRECQKWGDQYTSLTILSILEDENLY